jgi:hypothetical protein
MLPLVMIGPTALRLIWLLPITVASFIHDLPLLMWMTVPPFLGDPILGMFVTLSQFLRHPIFMMFMAVPPFLHDLTWGMRMTVQWFAIHSTLPKQLHYQRVSPFIDFQPSIVVHLKVFHWK